MIASENRKRFSPPIDADTLGDFFRRSRRCGSFEKSCGKIAQPDGLALLAIRSNDRRKSRERAHLANASEFNRPDMPNIGDFIRRSRRSAKTSIAAPGTPGDFRRSRRSAYKIARCVAGFIDRKNSYLHNNTAYINLVITLFFADFDLVINTKANVLTKSAIVQNLMFVSSDSPAKK